MDPTQNLAPPPPAAEQIPSESYIVQPQSSSQIEAPMYTYQPDQSAYAYYPEYQQQPYQYAYYDPSQQQAAYDQSAYANAYYQQPQPEQPPPPVQYPAQPDPAAAAAAGGGGYYPYPYYPAPQPQGVDYGGGAYGSVAAGPAPAQILQPSHRGGGRRGGRNSRGAGRGLRGRGRGRGRGQVQPQPQPQPQPQVQPPPQANTALARPPPQMAWCELCRVECNTPEILEQHRSGKKHKKNLKMQHELQRVMAAGHNAQYNAQSSSSQVKPEVADQPKEIEVSVLPPEGSLPVQTVNGTSEQQPQENLPLPLTSQAVGEDNNKAEPEQPKTEPAIGNQVRGVKRKTKSGRGGKRMKSNDGRRNPMEAPKPAKPAPVPLICELCNVTCESQIVFQTHLRGKRHLSNRKRFEQSQAVLGVDATQAMYGGLQAAYPALPQPNAVAATPLDPNLQQQSFPAPAAAPYVLPQDQEAPTIPAETSTLPASSSQPVDHQAPNPEDSKPADEAVSAQN